MGNQYVCHISGQGEKWEVRDGGISQDQWCVKAGGVCPGYYWLPKSEYRLCSPPEEWRDVTEQCDERHVGTKGDYEGHFVGHGSERLAKLICGGKYRLRKVHVNLIGPGVPHGCTKQWAFIVEQKVQP